MRKVEIEKVNNGYILTNKSGYGPDEVNVFPDYDRLEAHLRFVFDEHET